MRNITFLVVSAVLLAGCTTLPKNQSGAGRQNDETAVLAGDTQSELYLGIVDGLIRQKRYEAAIAFLAKYQKTGQLTPRFRLLAGQALSGAGRYEEAILSYQAALKSDMQAAARNGIGEAKAGFGDWVSAAESFRLATVIDPSNADYLSNFGFALLKRRPADPTSAALALERAYELAPQSHRIRNNLILAFARAGEREKLSALLAAEVNPKQRKEAAELAANWTPEQDDLTSPKGKVQ